MATTAAVLETPGYASGSTPPISQPKDTGFYAKSLAMTVVLGAALVPVLWMLAVQPEEPVSRAELVLLAISALANIAVISYHYLVPAHPKFLILPGRFWVLLVHIISGSVALVAGVVACFLHSRNAAIVQACAALFFHVPTAYLQVRIVFGSKAIMYPAYLLSITLHGFCAAMLLTHPDSHRWAVNTFLVFNIYTWCRVYFYIFDRMRLFASMKYTISIFAAGVTMLPALFGSMTMLVLTGFVLCYIFLQRLLFIRTPAEYLDFVREKSREGVVGPDMAAFWSSQVNRADDARIARAYFDSLAPKAGGGLGAAELQQALAPWGLSASALDHFANQLLAAGPVDFDHFLKEIWTIGAVRSRGIQIVLTEQAASDRDRAELVYRYADADHDGTITAHDLEVLLVEWGLPGSEAGRYLAHADRDGDGRLSFDEFFRGLRPFWRFIFYEVFRAQLNRRGTDDMIGRSARALRDRHQTGTLRRRVQHDLLARVPFLANAQPALIEDLAASMAQVSYRAGDVIFAEGSPGEDFHIVSKGIVRVSKGGATLADLGTGGCVGEGALLSNEPRSATVTALQDATLFSLRRSAFTYLTEKYPAVREQLRSLHTRRVKDTHVRTIQQELVAQVSFLQDAEPQLVNDLAEHLEIVRAAPGQIMFREGEPGDSFFIIEHGGAHVVRSTKEISRLGPGDCFGEGSLFSGQPRSATVTAAGASRFFQLKRDDFTGIISRYPAVHQKLLRLHVARTHNPFTAPA